MTGQSSNTDNTNSSIISPTIHQSSPRRERERRTSETSFHHDFPHFPGERHYRHSLVGTVAGEVLELGACSGKNLRHYKKTSSTHKLHVTVIDSNARQLRDAKRQKPAHMDAEFVHGDVCRLPESWSGKFDWVVSADLFPQLPTVSQPTALEEVYRVLKPGGRFRLVEIVASNNRFVRWRQNLFSSRKLAGHTQLYRRTLMFVRGHPDLIIERVTYLKGDTDLLIEGYKRERSQRDGRNGFHSPAGKKPSSTISHPNTDSISALVDLKFFLPDETSRSERMDTVTSSPSLDLDATARSEL